jgi:glycosyltransferase involved in cell wall biosynthesis
LLVRVALDATYSLGENLSGIGVYSREILSGVAAVHPEADLLFCYRPHRFLRSFGLRLPSNARRALIAEPLLPRSADVFHGLNQRLPLARLSRTVSTFHDLFVTTGDYSTPEFRRRFQTQARDAASRSERIIAVSEFTALQVCEHLGVERSRLRVIHHGVHMPATPPPDAAARERVVLNVGTIQKRKNITRLVRAFEALPREWRLALAGSHGYGAAEILEQIEHSPARSRIDLIGYLNRQELERWYARAAILAFPSLDEGFGMPVLEGMAWGLAVITSDSSALPEVAGDAALLVDPLDTDAIVHALELVVGNVELRRELARRGTLRAAAFTWEKAVSKTWSVYSELLAGA